MLSDFPCMRARIVPPRAIEHNPLVIAQAEIDRLKRVLAGEYQTRWQSGSAKGRGDGRKFYCFWTGADDNVDTLD